MTRFLLAKATKQKTTKLTTKTTATTTTTIKHTSRTTTKFSQTTSTRKNSIESSTSKPTTKETSPLHSTYGETESETSQPSTRSPASVPDRSQRTTSPFPNTTDVSNITSPELISSPQTQATNSTSTLTVAIVIPILVIFIAAFIAAFVLWRRYHPRNRRLGKGTEDSNAGVLPSSPNNHTADNSHLEIKCKAESKNYFDNLGFDGSYDYAVGGHNYGNYQCIEENHNIEPDSNECMYLNVSTKESGLHDNNGSQSTLTSFDDITKQLYLKNFKTSTDANEELKHSVYNLACGNNVGEYTNKSLLKTPVAKPLDHADYNATKDEVADTSTNILKISALIDTANINDCPYTDDYINDHSYRNFGTLADPQGTLVAHLTLNTVDNGNFLNRKSQDYCANFDTGKTHIDSVKFKIGNPEKMPDPVTSESEYDLAQRVETSTPTPRPPETLHPPSDDTGTWPTYDCAATSNVDKRMIPARGSSHNVSPIYSTALSEAGDLNSPKLNGDSEYSVAMNLCENNDLSSASPHVYSKLGDEEITFINPYNILLSENNC